LEELVLSLEVSVLGVVGPWRHQLLILVVHLVVLAGWWRTLAWLLGLVMLLEPLMLLEMRRRLVSLG
jgi:hypothetical protein